MRAYWKDAGDTMSLGGIGSGWRAHPLDDVVEDRFYMLRDTDLFGPPRDADDNVAYRRLTESDLHDAGATLPDDGATDEATATANVARRADGRYRSFPDEGEKVLGAAITVNRQLLFTTYVPDIDDSDVRSVSVGDGRLHVLDRGIERSPGPSIGAAVALG